MSLASRRVGIASALVLVPSVAVAQPSDTAAAPPPPPADAPAAHARGPVLEFRFEQSEPTTVVDPFGQPFEMPEPSGTIFAGYQLQRWTFGLGLQLARKAFSFDDDRTDDDVAATTFLLVPGARVALGGSADGRIELLGILDLGVGESRQESNAGNDDIVVERVHLQLGPGLRYWLHPSFAFGASALIRHARASRTISDPFDNTDRVEEAADTHLVTSLSVTGVF